MLPSAFALALNQNPSTLSLICPSYLSVLDDFPNDIPVVISLYDLLEALATRSSFFRPHLVLSNDIPPNLYGAAPLYALIVTVLVCSNTDSRLSSMSIEAGQLTSRPPTPKLGFKPKAPSGPQVGRCGSVREWSRGQYSRWSRWRMQ